MRRVFVIRKDLNMKPGKLAAMVGHCCEAYWTNLLKKSFNAAVKDGLEDTSTDDCVGFPIYVDYNVWHEYVNGIFTKTICECKNKEALHKIDGVIEELKLVEGIDFGYINDKRYAQRYIEAGKERKGKARLKMELARKGISDSVIEEALEEAEFTDARNVIREIMEKKRKGSGFFDEKEKRRLYAFFQRKGFSSADILAVIREEEQKEEEF